MNIFGHSRQIKTFILLIVFLLFITSCTTSGKSQEQLPKRHQDTEFKSDSGIRLDDLTLIQQQNLHTLAKVWGFVKYRHPDITGGNINWDAELFRIMPKVLKAESGVEATDIMSKWLEQFPFEVTALDKKQEELYRKTKDNVYLECDLSWISDREVLGDKLTDYLERLSEVKVTDTVNSYAFLESSDPFNALSVDDFMGDSIKYEDAGMRLLGLFRYWNIIEYFYPYKEIMNENWDQVLYDKIPELALEKSKESYVLSMANLTTYIHDSHGFFVDDFKVLKRHFGSYIPRAEFLNIDGQIVINVAEEQTNLKPGDIVLSVNGIPIEKRIEECRKYISVSDENRFINAFSEYILRSKEETAKIQVVRDGEELTLQVPCEDKNKSIEMNKKSGLIEEGKIGYLNLNELENNDFDKLMKKFKNTEGIIIDVRYGPPTAVFYILAEYINPEPVKYAQMAECNMFEPGNFYETAGQVSGRGFIKSILDLGENTMMFGKMFDNGILRTMLGKVKERYSYNGKVILIMNECTKSHLETTIMSLSKAPNATVIGTTSTGANGDMVKITLPGGIVTFMSGIAFNNADGTKIQRVGIQPDIIVEPTVKGIAAGRDELLEKAIETISK